MKRTALVLAMLLTASTSFAAEGNKAYEYSGTHAGGPADALIPNGTPVPATPPVRNPAYEYSGTHAGGPADALISDGTPVPAKPPVRNPAYEYSGTHAGGPANALPR